MAVIFMIFAIVALGMSTLLTPFLDGVDNYYIFLLLLSGIAALYGSALNLIYRGWDFKGVHQFVYTVLSSSVCFMILFMIQTFWQFWQIAGKTPFSFLVEYWPVILVVNFMPVVLITCGYYFHRRKLYILSWEFLVILAPFEITVAYAFRTNDPIIEFTRMIICVLVWRIGVILQQALRREELIQNKKHTDG